MSEKNTSTVMAKKGQIFLLPKRFDRYLENKIVTHFLVLVWLAFHFSLQRHPFSLNSKYLPEDVASLGSVHVC